MTPIIPPNHANAIAPFSPLGRRPVGEEDTDLKRRASTLKALEESAESAPGENRRSPDERAGEAGEQVRLSQGGLNRLNQQQVMAAERHAHEQPRRLGERSEPTYSEPTYSEPTYVAAVEHPAVHTPLAPSGEAGQLKADERAELLRQQAQKLLQSLRALRAMSPATEVVATGTDGVDTVSQEQAAKAHAEQRALIQRQIDLSRRLIDMGIDTDPAPLGQRLSRRI